MEDCLNIIYRKQTRDRYKDMNYRMKGKKVVGGDEKTFGGEKYNDVLDETTPKGKKLPYKIKKEKIKNMSTSGEVRQNNFIKISVHPHEARKKRFEQDIKDNQVIINSLNKKGK